MTKKSITLTKKEDASYKKMPTVSIKTKEPKYYGNIQVTTKQLPELKDWEVGEEYDLIVRVRQTGVHEPGRWEIEEEGLNKKDLKGEFTILSVSAKK